MVLLGFCTKKCSQIVLSKSFAISHGIGPYPIQSFVGWLSQLIDLIACPCRLKSFVGFIIIIHTEIGFQHQVLNRFNFKECITKDTPVIMFVLFFILQQTCHIGGITQNIIDGIVIIAILIINYCTKSVRSGHILFIIIWVITSFIFIKTEAITHPWSNSTKYVSSNSFNIFKNIWVLFNSFFTA